MNLPLNDSQILHIFAPWNKSYSSMLWREQILGNIVKPWTKSHQKDIPWFWFTSYSFFTNDNKPHGCELPPKYLSQHENGLLHRMVAVRLGSLDQVLIQSLLDNVRQSGCFPCIRENNVVEDLGSNRFISEDASLEERTRRAALITGFLWYTSALVLDSLVLHEDSSWHSEDNSDKTQNPLNSFFESVHHLFCNASSVPTSVLVHPVNNTYSPVSTFWNPTFQTAGKEGNLLILRIGY